MTENSFIREKDGQILLKLHVKPNSKIQGIHYHASESSLLIRLKSPPDKGKANRELIKLLAKTLGISSSAVTIQSGQTSRDKILLFSNISKQLVIEKLAQKQK